MMKQPKIEEFFMERKVPVYVLLLALFLGAVVTVLFGASIRHVIHGNASLGALGETMLTIAELPSMVKEIWKGGAQVIEDRFPDLDGFKKSGKVQEGALEDKGYLLLSAYDKDKGQATVQLIRIADQQVLHEWVPDLDALQGMSDDEIIKSSYPIYHPLLLEDGSLVSGAGGAKLINASSEIEWFKPGLLSHHSTEQDADGNIWVCSRMEPSSYAGTTNHLDDAIAKISPDGEVLLQKSVSKILEENGYQSLLMAGFTHDPIHLNDIQPALSDSRYWKKGDLLLSMRHRSTVALYRPSTNKIIWIKTGPWMNQHDADFISDHEISVFGNDLIEINAPGHKLLNGHSNIYIYDFNDDTVSTPYEAAMKSMKVRTHSDGRSEILSNGDVFIEETNDCRLLRLTPDTAKWEFVRRVDKDHLALSAWSRYLTEEQVRDVLPILAQSRSDQ